MYLSIFYYTFSVYKLYIGIFSNAIPTFDRKLPNFIISNGQENRPKRQLYHIERTTICGLTT